jgi:hypothetical protein
MKRKQNGGTAAGKRLLLLNSPSLLVSRRYPLRVVAWVALSDFSEGELGEQIGPGQGPLRRLESIS